MEHAALTSQHTSVLQRATKSEDLYTTEERKRMEISNEMERSREEIEELKRTIRDLRSELHGATLRAQTNVENTTRADVRISSLTRDVEEERARVQRLKETQTNTQTIVASLTTQIKTLESERDLLQGRVTVLMNETESDARTASEDRRKTEEMERELNQTNRELQTGKKFLAYFARYYFSF